MSAPKFDFKRLGQRFEVTWPVIVNVPQEGGAFSQESFLARFRLLEGDELKQVLESEEPHAFAKAFWIGMGPDEPQFNDELVARMLAFGFVSTALYKAYREFSSGAVAKN